MGAVGEVVVEGVVLKYRRQSIIFLFRASMTPQKHSSPVAVGQKDCQGALRIELQQGKDPLMRIRVSQTPASRLILDDDSAMC